MHSLTRTCMRVTENVLFPETSTVAQGEDKVNSWCRGEQLPNRAKLLAMFVVVWNASQVAPKTTHPL